MKTLVINKENPKGIHMDISAENNNISEPKELKISELKQKLSDTDYVACKIAEGAATREEYADILIERQKWREEINRLEKTE